MQWCKRKWTFVGSAGFLNSWRVTSSLGEKKWSACNGEEMNLWNTWKNIMERHMCYICIVQTLLPSCLLLLFLSYLPTSFMTLLLISHVLISFLHGFVHVLFLSSYSKVWLSKHAHIQYTCSWVSLWSSFLLPGSHNRIVHLCFWSNAPNPGPSDNKSG